MPRYRRVFVKGGRYFFTVVTEQRQPILTDEFVRNALREAINNVRTKYPFTINAWVLLPDHLHTIWTLPENDADFAIRWRLIKSQVTRVCGELYKNPEFLTERRLNKNYSTFWQHRYWEHLITDEQDYLNHVEYIHQNPVKHGYVTDAKEWQYSTIHKFK
jgi:putative transposase